MPMVIACSTGARALWWRAPGMAYTMVRQEEAKMNGETRVVVSFMLVIGDVKVVDDLGYR